MAALPRYHFQECDTCRAKSGHPSLCAGCIHNRTAITELHEMITAARERAKLILSDTSKARVEA